MVEVLAETAGFVAAKAMTPNQGMAIAKIAEVAAKVRGWPLPVTATPSQVVVEVQRFDTKNGEPGS
jgi:hypothetical protein